MIKRIKKENIPECTEVIRSSFMTVAKEMNFTRENAPRFTAFAITQERLERQFDEGRPMFAYCDEQGKIIGYYSLHQQENNECELNNLCVLLAYRHQKIGRQLMEHAFSVARKMGCTIMNISIVEENCKLRSWYESYGAVHVAIKKFDFFPFTCGYLKKQL